MRRITIVLLAAALMAGYPILPVGAAPASVGLQISEVQTGGLDVQGLSNGRLEFVELYNPGKLDLDVDGWGVNYYSASSDARSDAPTRILATLKGTVTAGGHVLLASADFSQFTGVTADISFDDTSAGSGSSGWLAANGGSVGLADATGTLQDWVGWGTAKDVDGRWLSAVLPAGTSIQRIVPGDPSYVTDGSFGAPSSSTSPMGGALRLPPAAVCEGAVLTEVLPNAAGTDEGHEFVEVFNPTGQPINLLGCSLRLGEEGPTFALPAEQLPAGSYRTFYDSESGITLPNATGDTVWLIRTDDSQSVRYPDNMGDDRAWALLGAAWAETNRPTPGAANEAPVEAPPEVATTSPGDDTLTACPAGKERNPETNRCRTVAPVTDGSQPCQSGQERSAETHRCRAVLAASTATASCKPGQERNAETNRCRSLPASVSTLKDCPEGQERNPATNRCRKAMPQVGAFAKPREDTMRHVSEGVWHWWLAGGIVALAAGYGIYEWRHEALSAFRRLRSKQKKVPG